MGTHPTAQQRLAECRDELLNLHRSTAAQATTSNAGDLIDHTLEHLLSHVAPHFNHPHRRIPNGRAESDAAQMLANGHHAVLQLTLRHFRPKCDIGAGPRLSRLLHAIHALAASLTSGASPTRRETPTCPPRRPVT